MPKRSTQFMSSYQSLHEEKADNCRLVDTNKEYIGPIADRKIVLSESRESLDRRMNNVLNFIERKQTSILDK